jgi:hypothetical protein
MGGNIRWVSLIRPRSKTRQKLIYSRSLHCGRFGLTNLVHAPASGRSFSSTGYSNFKKSHGQQKVSVQLVRLHSLDCVGWLRWLD